MKTEYNDQLYTALAGCDEAKIYEIIRTTGDKIQDKLIKLRQDFHKYPETGWLEMRTSAIIAKHLTELGYEVLTGKNVCREGTRVAVPQSAELKNHADRVKLQNCPAQYLSEEMKEGYTGVVGILNCGEGPVVALRFDIDALSMDESISAEHRPYCEGFASVNPGMMHACGHDCHAAIGLGTAEILKILRPFLHGTIKLLFQPGEEGTKGAYAMVKAGHLDDVDYFVGTHVAPDNGPDDGDITPGTYGSLATNKYHVYFQGRASHAGGFPEKGKSAILAAAHAVIGLSGIARHSEGISRVNTGVIHGGTSSNVVADDAMIAFEVRGESAEINNYMDKRAKEICRAAADMEGCICEMELMGHAPSQESSPLLIERIAAVIKNNLPEYKVSSLKNARNWGSEDIGFMMNRVQEQGGQAVYMRTMTRMASPQHTATFDVDESVIKKGAITFSAIVYDLLKEIPSLKDI